MNDRIKPYQSQSIEDRVSVQVHDLSTTELNHT